MSCTPSFPSLHLRHSSFSYPSVALPTSQLILQPFRCFPYVIPHSQCLLSLLLRHRLFTYVTWWAAHASKIIPCHIYLLLRKCNYNVSWKYRCLFLAYLCLSLMCFQWKYKIYYKYFFYTSIGGEGCLGFPDLWSSQKPWWTWYLTPVVNFSEVRRALLAKSTLLAFTFVPLGSFQIF